MKKFLIVCLLLTGSLFAQDNSGFNSTQRASLRDSLLARDALISALRDSITLLTGRIDTVGTSGMGSLPSGKFYIGNATGVASPRTISGDFTINYLGVGAIGSGKITNTMLAGSISPTKISASGRSISENEFSALDGVASNIQEQIDGINVGTGYLLSTGDNLEGDYKILNNYVFSFGTDEDLMIGHDGSYNSFASQNVPIKFGTTDAQPIDFVTNNTIRFSISSSGYLLPEVTKTYGLGSTSYEIKDIFAGRLKLTDSLNLGDNDYLTMGNGRDFIAYHDGVSTTNLNALSGNLVLKNSSATGDIYVNTNGSYRWGFNENGMFDPYAANTYDIGYNNTVRSLYLGTNLFIGGSSIGSIMQDSLDARLIIDNTPEEGSAATYTLDMSSTDIYQAYLTPDERDLDIYFSNYGKGITHKIKVYQTLGNNITVHAPSGKTLIWLDGLPIDVTETGNYVLWFSWSPNNELEVSWGLFNEE